MSEHDYAKTDKQCPDCGGELLIDVAYSDRSGVTSADQTVYGYDCQELGCGSQFTAREWSMRTGHEAMRHLHHQPARGRTLRRFAQE